MNEIVKFENRAMIAQNTITEDLFFRWIAYLDCSPKTVDTYTKSIKAFVRYTAENGINRPTREDIIAYREQLKADHKATTVQAYMAAVKLFFAWTEQENLYPNIAEHIKGAKVEPGHKEDYLTTKQVNKLLSGIDRTDLKGLRDYAMLALMVTTGLRTVSIMRANKGDIRTLGDNTVLYYQGKGHDDKVTYVVLAEPVEAALREYLKARGKASDTEPLFASISHQNNGARMTTRAISGICKDRLVSVGLDSDRLTAHSLRHTAAMVNLKNGATIEETQQLLDHSNINTTLIYVAALNRENNGSERRIAKAIFG